MARAEESASNFLFLIGFQYAPAWFPAGLEGDMIRITWSVVLNYEHPDARRAYTNYISQVTSRYKNSNGDWRLDFGNEYAYFDLWEPSRRFPAIT